MAELLESIQQDCCDPFPVVVHPEPSWGMDDEQFYKFCRRNKDLRIERSADGDLIILAPAGGSSSHGNLELAYQFQVWSRQDGSGKGFDSSGGFVLPNGAARSPDISWVRNERLETLSQRDWTRFLPLCPDFVLELLSPSDRLRDVQEKMAEYIENGAQLGWLIDSVKKQVHVYRPEHAPKVLSNPKKISGDPVLRGFTLDLAALWETMERKPRR